MSSLGLNNITMVPILMLHFDVHFWAVRSHARW